MWHVWGKGEMRTAISWLVQELFVSQEWLCTTGLVTFLDL